MKNKKINRTLFIIGLAILFSLIGTMNLEAYADVGNANRYDTGSYSSESFTTSSSDGEWFFIIYILFDLFVSFGIGGVVIFLVVVYLIYQFNKKTKGMDDRNITRNMYTTQQNMNQNRVVKAPSNSYAVEKVVALDPQFSEVKFLGWSKEVFIKLQNAWTKREWKEIRPFESNELFSQHSMQLEEYIRKGHINIVEKINISHARIKEFSVLGSNEVIVVELHAIMRDYVIDEKTKKVVEGIQMKDWNMKYEMTFARSSGVKTTIEDKDSTTNCPNCGAPTQITSSGQCDYCDSVITTGNYCWVLTSIKTI